MPMFTAILEWVRDFRNSNWQFDSRGRVLEVGSQNVNGSPRGMFWEAPEYIGIDAESGPGVDIVMPAADVAKKWSAEHFDTVLCFEMLEHDPNPWQSLRAMKRVLRIGGLLMISTPTFGFPLHRFPKDYYRFGEDAFREVLFSGCELLDLREVRDSEGSPCLCGAGVLNQRIE
jgi:SAM-dependent methyltransferase